MALTEEQYIQLIITSIGGDTTSAVLATNLPIFWSARDGVEDLNARALLVKIDGIDLLLGQNWKYVSFKALDGASVSASDIFDHLLKLRQLAQEQADRGADIANAGGAIGELLTTAPISPPCGYPFDANDGAYRGDAYRSRKRRGGL
jgi:NADH pyrophosphatase NudC (nudix superfamily)